MNIDIIKKLCGDGAMRWTNHIFVRLLQRGISINDVECSLMNGEIIEQYPNDYPYQSCLVLGFTVNKQYLHVVCGLGDGVLWLITAYYPNADEWADDFRTRKETEQ